MLHRRVSVFPGAHPGGVYRVAMLRRLLIATFATLFVASCSDCGSKCTEGITFIVADVAGSLARGTSEPLHICFDGECKDVTVSRDDAGGSVFLPFSGVGKDTDREITVQGTGSLQGSYKGPLASFTQDPGGDCKTCALATVKIGADGTLTPGVPAPQTTPTTVGAAAPGTATSSP